VTLLDNWANALQSAGMKKEALAVIEPKQARFPRAFDLQVRRALLLAGTGNPEAGSAHFLSLIETGLKDESELLDWVNCLIEVNRHDLAERAVEVWNEKQPSLKTRRWLADVIAQSGDTRRAVSVIEELAQENPTDEPTTAKFAELLNQAEDYTRAQEIAEKLLAGGKENARALQALGWSQMGRRWYREAKQTFERAARVRPNDDAIQDALHRASSALGQGSNSGVKEPLDSVPLPSAVARELAAASAPAALTEGQPAVSLARSTGYHFEEGKPLRRTMRRQIRILNQAGVNAYSSLEYSFHPGSERIFINKLEVRDAEAKLIASGSVDDVYVRDEDDGAATNRKVLHTPVPALRPGCTIDVEVTIEDRRPERNFPFTRYLFAYRTPCMVEAIFITGDTERVKHFAGMPAAFKLLKEDGLLGWVAHTPPVVQDEPFATFVETRAPILWLGGGTDDWKTVAKQYVKEIADRLAPDEAAANRATELCAGLTTEREKIAAIAREVQKTIGYKAIEFGVRARRPNTASETLRQRYGDCKDQSLLLHQLLRAAKIESHLALVHTEDRIQPGLPSLDQFNHMVVHVPALGTSWLIDPTNKHLSLAEFPAAGLWHSHALILDPELPRLLTPTGEPREGSCDVRSERTVEPNGSDWDVKETLTLTGYYAAGVRSSYSGETPAEQARRAQNVISANGHVQLKEFTFENLDEVSEPARLILSYTVPGAIATSGKKRSAIVPAFWEREYLSIGYVANRTTPFHFRYPFRFFSTVRLKLPPSASLGSFPAPGNGQFTIWNLTSKQASDGAPLLHFALNARVRQGEAKEYAAFHEGWDSARRAWTAPIEWQTQ
jgi:tetratricopeptide (TPR) repeat protein